MAKTAAEQEGLSLSAYVTRAVRLGLEEREGREAGRAILATFTPEERATSEEEREILALVDDGPSDRPRARRRSNRQRDFGARQGARSALGSPRG